MASNISFQKEDSQQIINGVFFLLSQWPQCNR